MRILIVEDDHKIAQALKRGLERQSYAVDVSHDGAEGQAMATTEPYDLVILDRMLPNADGMEILKAMRSTSIHTPVLLLTAKDRVLDRAEGLNAGADDYLVKPFAFIELLARVRALLRRPKEALDTTIESAGMILDRDNFTATRDNNRIELTAKEFALLEYLMSNEGRIVTKDHIIQHVWDYDADVLPNTVEVYIGYLRNKIDKPFPHLTPLITTRRGFGYSFGSNHS
ncbi:MAG TPA: response regulator transcription factor [Candidatus Saccharibacteria bacterium]|jgi:DNA-binding response OmpR family regulator|nr:response regulator transcription factor [Candidatus Saccharibacteria bacterium]